MAIPIADRVKDATNVIGQANAVLLNTAPAGYQTFLQGFGSSVGRNVCYCISNPNAPYEWETGFGTYTSSTNTLNRNYVTANSSGTQPTRILFPEGTKDVFCTTPSKSILVQDISGDINIPSVFPSGSVNIRPDLSSAGYAATGFNLACLAPTAAAQTGTYIDIAAGAGSTVGDGGYLGLSGGSSPGSGLGGDVYVTAGDGGTGGNIALTCGSASLAAGGDFTLVCGAGGTNGVGGAIQLGAGEGGETGNGGAIQLTAGQGGVISGQGGDIFIYAGLSVDGSSRGGNIVLQTGGGNSAGSFSVQLANASASAIVVSPTTTTNLPMMGFFGATPVVRPTAANTTEGTFVVNSGTAVNTASTFSGYTVGEIAAALVKLGFLT